MSTAVVPRLLNSRPKTRIGSGLDSIVLKNTVSILVGVVSLALLAQISIPLSFTPIPITGQTLGVALISLLWGRARGVTAVALYLAIGFLGAPVFAAGSITIAKGLSLGPSSGYLLGMLVASYVMGSFADRGWTNSFARTWIAAFTGSAVTFAFGLAVLSYYVPSGSLLMAGLIPFIPGDFIKTVIVVLIVSGAKNVVRDSREQAV